MTKYNAKKTTIDDIQFDSKIEASYYEYLKKKKLDGGIKDFELQPEFILQPKFEKDGKKYLPIKYKADFKVIYNDNTIRIVDVKGFETPLGTMKLKMYHYNFEYPLDLITYSKIDGGWISIGDLKKARKERKKAKTSN